MRKLKLALLAAVVATSPLTWAQEGKGALVKQFLDGQRPAIENLARAMVDQSSAQIAQAAAAYLQTQVPAEKRETTAKAAEAEFRKYFDDAYPVVRDKAVQLAPSTLGPILEKNFSEDELRQLNAWINSPLSKKYQDLNPELLSALTQKLVADTRGTIEPKMRTLDANVAKALGAPTDGGKAKGTGKK